MDEADVDAQRLGHLAVERTGADLHAQAGLGNQQVQTQGERNAHARHHQPVHRVREVLGQRDRPVQHLGHLHCVYVVAPEDGAHLFKDVDQAEGEQHLVEVVAVVKVPEQQPFQRPAQRHGEQRAHHDGQHQAVELRGQKPGEVGAQHVETAMGQIDHPHDAEDQGEAGGQHEQQQAVLQAVEQLDQEVGEVHRFGA
ncbi:hypothetical protein FQZ97_861870 [compost metagenome]